MKFYIVPPHVVAQYQGATNGAAGLRFVKDIHGRYVVNIEVSAEWPQIDWHLMEQEELTIADFPKHEEEDL